MCSIFPRAPHERGFHDDRPTKIISRIKGKRAQKTGRPARQHECFRAERPQAGSAKWGTHGCAAKHGFYTKNFSPAERKGLAAVKGGVLEEEIALLRVLIKRFAEKLLASEDVSLKESSQHLAVVSEAMLRLAGLLRTHHMLGGSDTDTLTEALSQALEQVTAEMALAGREGSAEY
jgi:hypothetical protein